MHRTLVVSDPGGHRGGRRTEAAGEGINLQVCHILFNYDIPWNPNRLEQRMGRIHRYGQLCDCLPHPDREAPEVRRLRPNLETEAIAMRVVMEHERAQGRGAASGTVMLTPNELRVAQDRPDC